MKISLAFRGLVVLTLLTSGCAGLIPEASVKFTGLDREARDRAAGKMTEAGLREEVLRFASRYMSAVGEWGMGRIEDKTSRPDERHAALRLAHSLTSSALEIAIGPSPTVNLLDMMVLTSLTRRRAEAAVDEVGGFYRRADLVAVVPTLMVVETDIWAVGDHVLTEEQLSALQGLIDAWLRENPDQGYVADVRIAAFAMEQGENELAEIWKLGFVPGLNLAPELDQASEAADEMRVLLERYLVYFQYLPATLRWESQLAYYQFILQPEVSQLLSNADQAAASTERIAAFLDRIPQEEEHLRALSEDLRRTILAGKEMAALVDQAVGSADAFLVGIEGRMKPGGRRFDIVDWQNTAVEVGVTARQLNDAVAQINALVTSPGWEQNLPQLVSALDLAGAETEEAVNHAFRQSLTLIGVFLGGSFVTGLLYQWAKQKLLAPGTRSTRV
ncbi:MAG: hypothetical protein JRG80_21465 [Deltaproteobacteria bacterium]|nr:hypothetical protein [Deltaproteobacteria bacterium]